MSTSDFVGEMVALVNKVDPSRVVDAASGGRDLCHRPPIQWQSCGKYGNFTDVHHCESWGLILESALQAIFFVWPSAVAAVTLDLLLQTQSLPRLA